MATLRVSGCVDATIGAGVRGDYNPVGQHHGKPVYKKTEQVDSLDVICYFWDGHDEPTYRGWWFAPGIGNDFRIWAFNPQLSNLPPRIGWKVASCEVDDTMVLSGEGVGQCNYQGCNSALASYVFTFS